MCALVLLTFSLQTKCDYHLNVAELKEKDVVGIGITVNGELHFYLNGVDQGIAARGVPLDCQLVIDLYGPVEEVNTTTNLKSH